MTTKLKVSQTAYTALEESVKHWEDNYNNYPNLKLGSDNCPLCQVFATDWNPCNGGPAGEVCPISRKVKDTCCDNTPYDDVYYHYKKAVNVSLSVSLKNAVKNELEFLTDLLANCEVEES